MGTQRHSLLLTKKSSVRCRRLQAAYRAGAGLSDSRSNQVGPIMMHRCALSREQLQKAEGYLVLQRHDPWPYAEAAVQCAAGRVAMASIDPRFTPLI